MAQQCGSNCSQDSDSDAKKKDSTTLTTNIHLHLNDVSKCFLLVIFEPELLRYYEQTVILQKNKSSVEDHILFGRKNWTQHGVLHILGGGNSNIFGIFTPILGEMIQFDEHIFQMGWFNHQLVFYMFFLRNTACLLRLDFFSESIRIRVPRW